jgi:alkylation response protein AidB-like acyl-CoA dehydrogenase
MKDEELVALACERVFPTISSRAETKDIDRSLWRELASLGLMGMAFEEGVVPFARAASLLASEGMDLGIVLSLVDQVMLCAYPLQVFASKALREEFLPSLCAGERIGAAAISEPESGGDPSRMRSTARRAEGGFVLQGVKEPVTNAPAADIFLVLASTDPDLGKDGISAFVLEKGAGLRVESLELGFLPTAPHGRVILDGARVPAGQLVGEEGWGHERVSRSIFLWERAVMVAVVSAFMEKLHHVVVSDLDPEAISPDVRSLLARCKVELTAHRVLADHLLHLTFGEAEGGRERMELLLYFGQALPQWVHSMRRAVEEAGLALDENAARMLEDLRLLEVGRSILDWQFQKLLF